MDTISKSLCDEKHKFIEETQKRNSDSIKSLEDRSRKLEILSIQLGEMLKTHNEKLDNHGMRIDRLESKDSIKWNKVVDGIISAIIASFMAFITSFFIIK